MIDQLNSLPAGLLDLQAGQLYQKLNDHTLIHLKGRNPQPLFISILQHGDEHTGWDALKDYLKQNINDLPRSLCILFGNITATKNNLRQMPNQPDFNRCWPGAEITKNEILSKQTEITDIVKSLDPFASIDIHNNSGRNPHYSGVNRLNKKYLNLASLFSKTMIHFTSPKGIQSGAFAEFCPSVTVECGLSGTSDGRSQTLNFLNRVTGLDDLETLPRGIQSPNVFKVFATVKIKNEISISFTNDECQFKLVENLDCLNFKKTAKGTIFGQIKNQQVMPFEVLDQNGNNETDNLFIIEGNKIVSKTPFIPAMITQNIKAIRDDCLCYLMKPLNIN